MSRGVTLIELLLALVLAALLAGLAAPRVAGLLDRAALAHDAARLRAALEIARDTGLRLGTVAALDLAGTRWEVRAEVGGLDQVTWRGDGVTSGTSLEGVGAPLRFGPAGIAVGLGNRTLRLRRGAEAREVVISRLGRVR